VVVVVVVAAADLTWWAHGGVVLEASEMPPDGFEPNLEWVGTREDVQMDMAAAEVSGVVLRSEYLWGHDFLEGKQYHAHDLGNFLQKCPSHTAGGLRYQWKRRAEGKGEGRGSETSIK
jgi:hypothetical protein